MAKAMVVFEDVEDGKVKISVISEPDFPSHENPDDYTPAQAWAMEVAFDLIEEEEDEEGEETDGVGDMEVEELEEFED